MFNTVANHYTIHDDYTQYNICSAHFLDINLSCYNNLETNYHNSMTLYPITNYNEVLLYLSHANELLCDMIFKWLTWEQQRGFSTETMMHSLLRNL